MTAVKKKFKRDFHLPPKANTSAKFQLSRLLGGLARECDGQTDGRTHGRTPGEYSANSGPAGLVPGPEFSNSEIQVGLVCVVFQLAVGISSSSRLTRLVGCWVAALQHTMCIVLGKSRSLS